MSPTLPEANKSGVEPDAGMEPGDVVPEPGLVAGGLGIVAAAAEVAEGDVVNDGSDMKVKSFDHWQRADRQAGLINDN